MSSEAQTDGPVVSRRKALQITGLGILLALPAGAIIVRRFTVRQNDTPGYPTAQYPPRPARVARKPLVVSFTGPFSYGKELASNATGNTWIRLSGVHFSEFFREGKAVLNVFYGKTADGIPCEVHTRITITDRSGKQYRVVDDTGTIFPGPREDVVAGAVVGQSDALLLPVRLAEIMKLDMEYVPKET